MTEETADNAPTVVCVGNALIDRTYLLSNLPEPDGGAHVVEYVERPGGVEANVASALRALGHDAGMIARLGDDDVGNAVLADLDERDVDRRRVRVVEGEVSAYCLVLRDRAGERMIIGGGDGTNNLRLEDDDADYLAGADVAFASGYVPGPVVERLAAVRREDRLGALAFDLAGRMRDIEPRGLPRKTIDGALPAVDCFVGNERAVASYTGEEDVGASIEALRSRGVSAGAVTTGADGATLFHADEIVEVPAFDVDVVDTTGAGDAFTAGLIHGTLLSDIGLRQAGWFAAAAAALACTAEGARGKQPTAEEVRAFLSVRDERL